MISYTLHYQRDCSDYIIIVIGKLCYTHITHNALCITPVYGKLRSV